MKINNSTKIIISASSSPGNFGSTLYNKFFKTLRLNYIYIPMKFLKMELILSYTNLFRPSLLNSFFGLKDGTEK